MNAKSAFLSCALLFCAAGCHLGLTDEADDTATSASNLGTRPVAKPAVTYRLRHGGTNLTGWGYFTEVIETATGTTEGSYVPHAEAGAALAISTTSDGIYTQGAPQPNPSCGCCSECDPWTYPENLTTSFTHWYVGWKVDGVLQPEVDVTSGTHEAALNVPASANDTLEYWFRFTDARGNSYWDSRSGANYVVPITPAAGARITFDETGAPKVSGDLVPGGAVRVDYDYRRLAALDPTLDPRDLNYATVDVTFGDSTMHDDQAFLIPANDGVTPDLAAKSTWLVARVTFLTAFRIPLDATSVKIGAHAYVPGKTPGSGATMLVDGPAEPYTFAMTGGCPTGKKCDVTTATFSSSYATTSSGQNIYVVGSIPELGSWDPTKALRLTASPYPSWSTTIALPKNTSFEYKLVRIDGAGHVDWEPHANRNGTTTNDSTASFGGTWGG